MSETAEHTAAIDEPLRRKFEASWANGAPLPIESCLPPDSEAGYLPTLEELILIDLEFRWEQSVSDSAATTNAAADASQVAPPCVEDYVRRFPQLDRRATLLRLLRQEYLVRTECHDEPQIEEYRARFPGLDVPQWDIAASLDETLVAAPARWSAGSDRGPPDDIAPALTLPMELGHYELLEELGRGGMGVVYLARQRDADRIVALKVIRRELLHSLAGDTQTAALERFRHEVQAAASLQHESIVAVYEVGDLAGQPFFSMQYVEGDSLGEMLQQGPLENRRAAAYLQQVARAVAAAHERGILHRDLKPQNILVDRRTDRPLVADFGLAKLQGSSDELTHSGDVMGSPPYMSPEQATDSSRVSFPSDVYALGATLYHLLTGRPPFHAATRVETIYQVVNEQPVPPRRLNVRIDQDLETICLKCLDKSTARRYASAEALADELRRYLDHKPILARHLGPVGRGWRWCQRNPSTAVSLGLAVTFLIAALVAATVGYLKTSHSLVAAEQARAESDESFRQARNVVDRFFTEVSENDLLDLPGLQPLRRELLEEAIVYYEQFLEQRGKDPTVRDELAATHFRVGRIRELIGVPDEALQAYRRAASLQTQLLADAPDNTPRQAALGDTWNGIGRVLHRRNEVAAALDAYHRAREIRERLAAAKPENTEYGRMLANTCMNLGLALGKEDPDAARSWFDRATNIRSGLSPTDPLGTARIRRDQAMGDFNAAVLEIRAGTHAAAAGDQDASEAAFEAAERNLAAAIEAFEKLVATNTRGLGNRFRLATCYRLLADVQSGGGRFDEALEGYEQSRRQIELLVLTNPDVAEYQATLAGLHMNVGLLHSERDHQPAALERLNLARELLAELVDDDPEAERYRSDLAVTLMEIARLEYPTEAELCRELLQAALGHVDFLRSIDPESEQYQLMRRELLDRLQPFEGRAGDPEHR